MIPAVQQLETKKFNLNARVDDYLDEISQLKKIYRDYEKMAKKYLTEYQSWMCKAGIVEKEIDDLQNKIGNIEDEVFQIDMEIIHIFTPRPFVRDTELPFEEVAI